MIFFTYYLPIICLLLVSILAVCFVVFDSMTTGFDLYTQSK